MIPGLVGHRIRPTVTSTVIIDHTAHEEGGSAVSAAGGRDELKNITSTENSPPAIANSVSTDSARAPKTYWGSRRGMFIGLY